MRLLGKSCNYVFVLCIYVVMIDLTNTLIISKSKKHVISCRLHLIKSLKNVSTSFATGSALRPLVYSANIAETPDEE